MAEEILNKAEKDLLSKIDEKELINFLQKAVQSNSENPRGMKRKLPFSLRKNWRAWALRCKCRRLKKTALM